MSTPVVEGFRLSPRQREIWARQGRGGAAAAFCHVRIDGPLDLGALRRAVRDTFARHEILRTYFPVLPGMAEPLQVIAEAFDPAVVEKAGGASEDPPRWSVEQLSEKPLARVDVVRLSPERHLLRLVLPALCADSATLLLLAEEIAGRIGSSGASAFAEAPSQYADVAEWLNDLAEEEAPDAAAAFWKRSSAGSIPALDLPFARVSSLPDPPSPSGTAAVKVEASLHDRLRAAGERLGCGDEAILLSAFEALLSRHSRSSEFVLFREASGRRVAEIRDVLGPLARLLPLAVDLPEDATIESLAVSTARGADEQERWQASAPRETPTASAAFQFHAIPAPVSESGTVFRVEDVRIDGEPFALALECLAFSDSLRLRFRYDPKRFVAGSISSLAEAFAGLLEAAVESPATPVDRLPMSSPAAISLADVANRTDATLIGGSVLSRFEEQARKTPGAPAVVYESEAATYGEIDRRANGLAGRLRRLGLPPDAIVGILAERSIESVVAILGIWKAGAGYLPIEVSTPAERRRFMLADSGASALVAGAASTLAPGDCPCPIVRIDEPGGAEAGSQESAVPSKPDPNSLAYVIYTSGSTGQPKGVGVEHRQLSNYVGAILERLSPEGGWNFAMVSTLAADLGHTVLFPPLVTGGTLHVIAQERASDPEALGDYFDRHAIDVLKIVPSHFAALLGGTRPEAVVPRRCLVFGGEALSWELVRRVRDLAPDRRILNHYGPTETTVGATTFEVPSPLPEPFSRTVPIGRPVANARAYILDAAGQSLPVWAPGELFLAGAGVARGYANREDLTRERFLPDPFRAGDRMYRTGDLARRLPDGSLEWLGRVDDQVKVRGYRVELGEIEARLRAHPGVEHAVVLLREDSPGDRRLVAYWVPRRGEGAASEALAEFLRTTLPDFMVPSAFVTLDRLPLTPNGKLHRAALPAPQPAGGPSRGDRTAPRDPAEESLAGIWREVLRLETVGVHQNFFHLGGDSILAIQIVARANRAGLRLTPRQLFEHQTVAELAAVVGQSREVRVDQGPVSGAVELSPIQRWFFEQELVDVHHYNQATMLRARGAVDPAALRRAVERLVEHHDALRLRFRRGPGGWKQTNAAPSGEGLFTSVHLGGLSGSARLERIAKEAAEAQAGLDLEAGPIVRAVWFDGGGAEPGRLLLAVHHLGVDGVSWRILREDLETAYRRALDESAPDLPARTTSFQTWSARLAEHVRAGRVDREIGFWAAQRGTSSLPREGEGPNLASSESVVDMELDLEETRSLLQNVPAAWGTQINDALLMALLASLSPWTGERSLLVALEGHGREEIFEGVDLSRTIGWFTARFPFRLRADDPADAAGALRQIKEQLRAIPHRGIGFGMLRYLSDAGSPGAVLRSMAEPEVSFNYWGQMEGSDGSSSAFVSARDPAGATRSARQIRKYLISVDGSTTDGRLRFAWSYSENVHRRATIEGLAARFAESLRSLIRESAAPDAGAYTPSDFPKAKLSQKSLDKLLSRLD